MRSSSTASSRSRWKARSAKHVAQTAERKTIDRAAIEGAASNATADERDARLRAFERFESTAVPTERTEGWRRTELSGIDLTPPTVAPTRCDVEMPEGAVRAGVTSMPLDEALASGRAADTTALRPGLSLGRFTALAQAAWRGGGHITVPAGVALAAPIVVRWDGGPYPRLHVAIESGARATIVEWHDKADGLSSGVVDLVVGDGAHLTYVHVQDQPGGAVVFSHQHARVGRDAKLVTLNFAIGARMSRADVEVELIGQGAESDMLGLVFGENEQQFDFHTLQGHRAPDTRSDLLFKSALDDRSHSTYTGVISIGKDAPRSQAYQANRNLLLSEGARADTEPKLEILIDDVARCTHGATVGPVDDEQMFYLRSRGLDPDTATRLIVEGFFQEVFEKTGDTRATERLQEMVAPHVGRLGAH